MEEYDIRIADSIPSKEQINELSAQGLDLVQVVEHKGEFFVYLKRIWDGANVVIQKFEYNILEADSLPNEDNLGDVLTGGWEFVQLISTKSNVYIYIRRCKNGGL